MWAVRRPTVGEWSRSLARSAWVRVRHAARTSVAAAAGSLGGAAAAASDTLTQAATAGAGSVARATDALTSRLRARGHAADGSGQQPDTAGRPPQPRADAGTAAGGRAGRGGWWSQAGAALGRSPPRWLRKS